MLSRIRLSTISSPPPEVHLIEHLREIWTDYPTDNKYKQYAYLYKHDAEVRGAIDKLALLVAESFHGYSGTKETMRKDFLYQAAKRVLIYGDSIYLRSNLQALPMEFMTILEKRDQINSYDSQIFEANYYVLNEWDDQRRKIFPAKNIVHLKLDPTPMKVYDLLGRYTFGVWSTSPLETLKTLILWRHQMLYLDVLWRNKNLPREHHKLDLSAFSPDFYPGSIQERIAKARADAQRALESYVETVRYLKPDQAYVTSKDVEITYVEPKSTNYQKPNELLEQLSDYIYSSIGIHPGAVKGKSSSSYAGELVVKSYTGLVVASIAESLARQYSVQVFGKEYDPIINLELEIDKTEKVRQIVLLLKSGVITINEARQMLLLPPIEGGDSLAIESRGRPVGTPEARPKQPVDYPDSPESRFDQDYFPDREVSQDEGSID